MLWELQVGQQDHRYFDRFVCSVGAHTIFSAIDIWRIDVKIYQVVY